MAMASKIIDLSVEVVGNGFQVKIVTPRNGLLGKLGFLKSGEYVATSADDVANLCADLVRSCINGGPITFKSGESRALMERA
jgi:hypothetical protein